MVTSWLTLDRGDPFCCVLLCSVLFCCVLLCFVVLYSILFRYCMSRSCLNALPTGCRGRGRGSVLIDTVIYYSTTSHDILPLL